MADPPDEELLARVASSEREALRLLYERYSQRVFASAIKHTTDPEIASDIVQDVFLAVWIGAKGFRPERGTGEQWLFAITRNKVQDHWRRLGRLGAALVEVAGVVPTELVPEGADGVARRESVARALAALNPEQRELVELVYLKDLRFQEAARALGIPLGTVKSRIHVALAAMRGALEARR